MSRSKYEIECSACSQVSTNLLDLRCNSCGHPLDVKLTIDFEDEKIRESDYNVWRYADFFPYVEKRSIVSLGEGWTPLVKFSENVSLKLENLNPTGSFKDRGSTVLISGLRKLLATTGGYISEDSSGNAGASLAAYAARAGLRARIYVPENISGPKSNQIRFYGAEVVKVTGGRGKVAEEAQRSERRKFYVGHILHPLFRDGLRSLAYEIAEQSHWLVPDRIYLPASAGTLLLGVISGFEHMFTSKMIKKLPKIVGCQTRQVSPLFHRFKKLSYTPPVKVTSIADALVSTDPPLLDLMVEYLTKARGDAIVVEEEEIFTAFNELARNGFFVEPSSAVAYAAYKKHLKNGQITKTDKTIIILTGSGLKATASPIQ